MNKEELKEMCSNWYEEGCKDTIKEVLELIDERIEFLKEYDDSSHQIQIRAEFLLLKSRITEDRSKK